MANLWVVKNRNSSKGVGIGVQAGLQGILARAGNRLVQKYIEQTCTSGGAQVRSQGLGAGDQLQATQGLLLPVLLLQAVLPALLPDRAQPLATPDQLQHQQVFTRAAEIHPHLPLIPNPGLTVPAATRPPDPVAPDLETPQPHPQHPGPVPGGHHQS